ncbi:DENN-domain-containing protein [Hortaea werneckii]|nr:DENN-domain-containing protein [Hortaea werneckii]
MSTGQMSIIDPEGISLPAKTPRPFGVLLMRYNGAERCRLTTPPASPSLLSTIMARWLSHAKAGSSASACLLCSTNYAMSPTGLLPTIIRRDMAWPTDTALPATNFGDGLDISPAASQAYPSAEEEPTFPLTPLLTLPAAFGAAYVGETFACTLCVNNEVQEGENRSGSKAISVTVTYTETLRSGEGGASGGRVRSFRKLYQFVSQQLIAVRSKVTEKRTRKEDAQRQWILEAQLENVGEASAVLEKIWLKEREGVTSRALVASEEKEATVLKPQDVEQVMFILEEQDLPEDASKRVPLGQLNVGWRNAMGERGSLTTGWLANWPFGGGHITLTRESRATIQYFTSPEPLSLYTTAVVSSCWSRSVSRLAVSDRGEKRDCRLGCARRHKFRAFIIINRLNYISMDMTDIAVVICRFSFAWMDLVSYKDYGGADLANDEGRVWVAAVVDYDDDRGNDDGDDDRDRVDIPTEYALVLRAVPPRAVSRPSLAGAQLNNEELHGSQFNFDGVMQQLSIVVPKCVVIIHLLLVDLKLDGVCAGSSGPLLLLFPGTCLPEPPTAVRSVLHLPPTAVRYIFAYIGDPPGRPAVTSWGSEQSTQPARFARRLSVASKRRGTTTTTVVTSYILATSSNPRCGRPFRIPPHLPGLAGLLSDLQTTPSRHLTVVAALLLTPAGSSFGDLQERNLGSRARRRTSSAAHSTDAVACDWSPACLLAYLLSPAVLLHVRSLDPVPLPMAPTKPGKNAPRPAAASSAGDTAAPLADYFFIAGIESSQVYEESDDVPPPAPVEDTIDEERVLETHDESRPTTPDASGRRSRYSFEARKSIGSVITSQEPPTPGSNRSSTTIRAVQPARALGLEDDATFEEALKKFASERENFLEDIHISAGTVPTPTQRKPRPRTVRITQDESSPNGNASGLHRGVGSIRRRLSTMNSMRRQQSVSGRQSSVKTSKRLSGYNSVIPAPQPFHSSPDMHPLKRHYEPVLLDRYPTKTMVDESKRRNPFPDYVPMFAFPNDVNVVSSDERPRSSWHGFAMTAGDNSKLYGVCVTLWVPLNQAASENLEQQCEEWRKANMSDEERELASSLGERFLGLKIAKSWKMKSVP